MAIGRTNCGQLKVYAIIGVTYLSGTTCTCSDGSKTLKLKDTSGLGFFSVPCSGTWTVSCSNGISKSVEITDKYQVVNITLNTLQLLPASSILFEQSAWAASGGTGYGSATVTTDSIVLKTWSYADSAGAISIDTVDLSSYNNINITVAANNKFVLGITTNKAAPHNSLTKSITLGSGTFSLDISDVSGEYYIAVGGGGAGVGGTFTITKITLTP